MVFDRLCHGGGFTEENRVTRDQLTGYPSHWDRATCVFLWFDHRTYTIRFPIVHEIEMNVHKSLFSFVRGKVVFLLWFGSTIRSSSDLDWPIKQKKRKSVAAKVKAKRDTHTIG